MAARRYWDDYSPPHVGGFKPGANDTYHWTSESIITGDATTAWQAAIYRLNVWKNTYNISNTDSAHSRYSGYASIYFSDSDADGRQMSSEVCRTSGKVDAVRIPKELYYAHAVVAASQPAGDITLTASRSGLASATATVTSKGVTVTDGLN